MSSKVLKSQRISKKPAVDCLLIGQNPLKLARSVLGRIWISDQPRSQTGTLATQHGLPRPQIVLYALPTSPKNTFLNFCGDLRQVLTMGKLMVHPALARFGQKTRFPKITKIKILTFFSQNLLFPYTRCGPSPGFLAAKNNSCRSPGPPGNRSAGPEGQKTKLRFFKFSKIIMSLFSHFGGFGQNRGWTMSFPITKNCRKSTEKLMKLNFSQVARPSKTI